MFGWRHVDPVSARPAGGVACPVAVAADRMDGGKGSEAACQRVRRKDQLHLNWPRSEWFWRMLAASLALCSLGLSACAGRAYWPIALLT
jgi:hypothetical protein